RISKLLMRIRAGVPCNPPNPPPFATRFATRNGTSRAHLQSTPGHSRYLNSRRRFRLDHAARCLAIANSDPQSSLSVRIANQRAQTTSNRHAPLSLREHKVRTVFLEAKAGLLLALLALASCETTHSSRVAASSAQAALDAQVPALLGKYRIASVGVALIVEGRVVLERGYGEQSAGVSATPATLFNLASLTKPVTAEVLLRLIAARQLSLDEPMSSH